MAELGRFDEAVLRQEEALKSVPLTADDRADYEARLGKYRQRQPWRE